MQSSRAAFSGLQTQQGYHSVRFVGVGVCAEVGGGLFVTFGFSAGVDVDVVDVPGRGVGLVIVRCSLGTLVGWLDILAGAEETAADDIFKIGKDTRIPIEN